MVALLQKGWEDITLAEYLDLEKINSESVGLLNRSLETLCYLTDNDGWEYESSGTVLKTYLDNKWLSIPPTNQTANDVSIYKLKPISKLTLAEWIDLDSCIVKRELTKIPAILYRKFKSDEWGNVIYEPYEYSLTDRSNQMEDYPITKMIGAINEAYKYRENLHKVFHELFESYEDENLTNDEKEQLSPGEVKEIEESIKRDNKKKSFAWQRLLDDMANKNWASIPAILDLPHTFVFNMRLSRKVYGD
jgi:hypothetical protein